MKNNIDNNKYYVFGTDWNGMKIEDIYTLIIDKVCDTKEEAIEEMKRMWKEELMDDEGCYYYHNGELVSDEELYEMGINVF